MQICEIFAEVLVENSLRVFSRTSLGFCPLISCEDFESFALNFRDVPVILGKFLSGFFYKISSGFFQYFARSFVGHTRRFCEKHY